MKKLVIVSLLLINMLTYSQRRKNVNEAYFAYDMSLQTASDSVLFYYTDTGTNRVTEWDWHGGYLAIQVNYESLDDADATIDIGKSNDGYGFASLDSTLFPFTLDIDNDSLEVNGSKQTSSLSDKASLFYESSAPLPYKYIPIWIDKGSVTSGYLYIWIREVTE